MECLKGYSAKACFVLTRGVGWKLPTFATHYTTYRFVPFSLSPTRPVASPDLFSPSPPASREQGAGAALPSAGQPAGPPETPEMSRLPPSPPPPLNSGRRVGLPRPPPLTLDASDGNGAAAAGDEEENRAHGTVWEDSFAPFSQGFGATDELGDTRPAA
jgi:hypothetical protein